MSAKVSTKADRMPLGPNNRVAEYLSKISNRETVWALEKDSIWKYVGQKYTHACTSRQQLKKNLRNGHEEWPVPIEPMTASALVKIYSTSFCWTTRYVDRGVTACGFDATNAVFRSTQCSV